MVAAELVLGGRIQELLDADGRVDNERVTKLSVGIVAGCEVEQILQSDLYRWSLDLWNTYRLFGLPHGGGWLHERPIVVESLSIWKHAERRAERMLHEKK